LLRDAFLMRGRRRPTRYRAGPGLAHWQISRTRPGATGKVDRYAHDITKLKGMAARYLTLNITARAGRI